MDKKPVVGPSEVDLLTAHAFHEVVENSGKREIYSNKDQDYQDIALDILEHKFSKKPSVDLSPFENVRKLVDKAEEKSRIDKRNVELEKLSAEFENQAMFDHLTGIANRRYFARELSSHIEVAKRNNLDLAVAMMDINNFKDVNDTYGHAVGDVILQIVADSLKKVLRGSDFPSRYGGDEFALILLTLKNEGDFFGNKKGVTGDGVRSPFLRINEEIHRSISNYARTLPGGLTWDTGIVLNQVPIYISAGVGFLKQCRESSHETTLAEVLVDVADKNLYKYKQKNMVGRNVVKVGEASSDLD